MQKQSKNQKFRNSKNKKRDDLFTPLTDIEYELRHYKKHFFGKVIYCNCDDPRTSNFFRYFFINFRQLGLKKLIASCYKNQTPTLFKNDNFEPALYVEFSGEKNYDSSLNLGEIPLKKLDDDGDFRGNESINLLKQADIIVSYPPFSLFREYINQLIEYDKKFVIIGHKNAFNYKEILSAIKNNKLWLGYGFKEKATYFNRNESTLTNDNKDDMVKVWGFHWFTNLEIKKRNQELTLYKYYSPEEYPNYDNINAINVNKTSQIPKNYKGIMGVPLSFLDKYNPLQFEILGNENDMKITKGRGYINGKRMYGRIFIKNKKI